MGSKNGSNVKHICLSKNEKSWQTKQEKMIKAQNEARSHALNHSSKNGYGMYFIHWNGYRKMNK